MYEPLGDEQYRHCTTEYRVRRRGTKVSKFYEIAFDVTRYIMNHISVFYGCRNVLVISPKPTGVSVKIGICVSPKNDMKAGSSDSKFVTIKREYF